MEQYDYKCNYIKPLLAGEKRVPCLSLTKESTYTIYKDHHRYILHHRMTCESVQYKRVFDTVIGKLYLIDDMGYRIPCENIPITFLSVNATSNPITYTDDKGNYSFIHHVDGLNSLHSPKNMKTKRKVFLRSLPIIQAVFPLDTTIADQENVLIEYPYPK